MCGGDDDGGRVVVMVMMRQCWLSCVFCYRDLHYMSLVSAAQ